LRFAIALARLAKALGWFAQRMLRLGEHIVRRAHRARAEDSGKEAAMILRRRDTVVEKARPPPAATPPDLMN